MPSSFLRFFADLKLFKCVHDRFIAFPADDLKPILLNEGVTLLRIFVVACVCIIYRNPGLNRGHLRAFPFPLTPIPSNSQITVSSMVRVSPSHSYTNLKSNSPYLISGFGSAGDKNIPAANSHHGNDNPRNKKRSKSFDLLLFWR